MAVQADVTAALEGDREDLVRTLAEYKLLPTVVDRGGGSSLLGKKASPTVKLEAQSDETGTVDRQTTVRVTDALELYSAEAVEALADEVQSHDAW
ncbi:MAG: hypothetical protein GWN07_16000 [Actinobacteria bacterium]|nr:hypothetical protein [Actinomycetota bacterium]NIX21250.1 hypothetical protein [Actinomycetota bacterium]